MPRLFGKKDKAPPPREPRVARAVCDYDPQAGAGAEPPAKKPRTKQQNKKRLLHLNRHLGQLAQRKQLFVVGLRVLPQRGARARRGAGR